MSPAWRRLQRLRPIFDFAFAEKPELFVADLVRFARDSQSKDPRDKVFGLLALLPNSTVEWFSPNYDPSFSIQDAFTMFFKSCYGKFRLLSPSLYTSLCHTQSSVLGLGP